MLVSEEEEYHKFGYLCVNWVYAYYARHLRLAYFLFAEISTCPARPVRAWSMSMRSELFHDGRCIEYMRKLCVHSQSSVEMTQRN